MRLEGEWEPEATLARLEELAKKTSIEWPTVAGNCIANRDLVNVDPRPRDVVGQFADKDTALFFLELYRLGYPVLKELIKQRREAEEA